MLEHAKAAAQRGLAVFPIRPGEKKPALKDWQSKATTYLDTIQTWWAFREWCNVGIHCAGLLVLDVDAKPERDGRVALRELVAQNGTLPRTYMVKTPSGGLHLYYRLPADAPRIGNRVDVLPGLDIRSDGGYVVGAGSWLKGPPPVDYYTTLHDGEIVEAPQWLLDFAAEAAPASVTAADEATTGIDTDRAAERARDWLTKRKPAVSGEGGDAHTFVTIARVREYGVPEDEAAEVLSDWNDRCDPPWSPTELAEKIRNAYQYARNAPGAHAVESWFDDLGEPEPSPYAEQPAQDDFSREETNFQENDPAGTEKGGNRSAKKGQKGGNTAYWSATDLDEDAILTNNYTVKGWLPGQALALLFGAPGAGKTFLSLDIAAHVVAGEPWFGHRVRKGGALLFAYEGRVSMQRRVYALRENYPDFDLGGLWVAPMSEPLSQNSGRDAVTATLKAYLESTGAYPRLIVIDPLADAAGFTDDDQELVGLVIRRARALAEKTKATVLIAHHPGRQETHRARGSSIIDGTMDTIIRADGLTGTLHATKQRDDACNEAHYRLAVAALGVDEDGDPVETCVVEQLNAGAGVDTRLTSAEEHLLENLRAFEGDINLASAKTFMPDDWPDNTKRRVFMNLQHKGYLVSEDGSKKKLTLADAHTDPGFDDNSD